MKEILLIFIITYYNQDPNVSTLNIMYVDDSGAADHKDKSEQYILSGVIVHKDNVKNMKNAVNQYKTDHFIDDYIDAEIHTHDIFKSREEFTRITLETKYQLLNNLYNTVSNLDITTISVIINKKLLKEQYPTWKVFNTAWTYLIERFDKHIECGDHANEGGIVKIDKSTSKQQADVFKIVNELRKEGSYWQNVNHIIQEPTFVNSAGVEGVQVADAIAYCTFRNKTGSTKFKPYWDKIYDKFRKGSDGRVSGYGIKEFPEV